MPFESTCVMWLPDRADVPVSGILRFKRDTGLSVEVIGSLDPEAHRPLRLGLDADPAQAGVQR